MRACVLQRACMRMWLVLCGEGHSQPLASTAQVQAPGLGFRWGVQRGCCRLARSHTPRRLYQLLLKAGSEVTEALVAAEVRGTDTDASRKAGRRWRVHACQLIWLHKRGPVPRFLRKMAGGGHVVCMCVCV